VLEQKLHSTSKREEKKTISWQLFSCIGIAFKKARKDQWNELPI
jgi:hypothetical protein